MDTSLSPEERATLLIDAMTLDQKMEQLAMEPVENTDLEGCGFTRIGRHIEPIPELAIPVVRMTNGPSGVGGGDCEPDPTATALPSGIGVAASFDREMAFMWGDVGGAETRAGAHNVFLAPGLNLARVPHAGRNFEYFGEDPYLTGVMGVEEILAIQSNNVHANPKHFAFNEQETGRRTMNTIVPPRAAHELYLLPFEMAVKDGEAASLMCSFPRIYDEYACENDELLNDVLRERWGFEGYVFSDRNATMSTVPSIDAGLDLEFPQRIMFAPDRLQRYLDSGRISEADFDRMLFNRYTQMFKFGLFDFPVDDYTDIDFDAHGQTAREIATAGMVLLKNEGGVLPLDANVGSIALLGPEHFAGQAKLGPNSPNIDSVVEAPYTVTPEEGLNNVIESLGGTAEVTYTQTDDVEEAADAAAEADVAIVMVGDLSVEGQDRPTIHLEGPDTYQEGQDGFEVLEIDQEELISAVAAANPNTVVVLKNGGPILMPWLDEVPAILEAWYPGQEDGNAVADVLFGVVNPSGKLPFTFPTEEREAAAETVRQFPGTPLDEEGGVAPDPEFGAEDTVVREAEYSEDLEMGYRWYEANGVTPVFPFGFGLSYTTFEYSDLVLTPIVNEAVGATAVTVTFTITNTGDVAGSEAGQVYLTLPDEADQPSKRLVGFDKVHLEPGASEQVTIVIDSAASNHPFSYFEPVEGGKWSEGEWVTPDGDYTVHVGPSSADVPLEQTLALTFPEGGEDGTSDIPIGAQVPGGPGGGGEPGSLVLTIADFGEMVDLGTAKRSSDRFRWDGELPNIVVTDTRTDAQAGDAGWTVSGWADDFESETDSFSAGHLGWVPWTTADNRPGVDPGPPVDGIMRGGPGLAEPQTLVSATSEGRMGAATAGAHLFMEVPLTQAPGDYRSSIRLSLFPVD